MLQTPMLLYLHVRSWRRRDRQTYHALPSHSAPLQDGAALFLSTINRTEAAYAVAIVAAEQVLKEVIAGDGKCSRSNVLWWQVPAGTHDWQKFITPDELRRMLRENRVQVEKTEGMVYNPISGTWTLQPVTWINYAMYGIKDGPSF